MFLQIPNLRIHNKNYEIFNKFKIRQNFYIEIKNVAKIVYFHKKKHFAAPLKENKTLFMKKFHEFVDSEFMKI